MGVLNISSPDPESRCEWVLAIEFPDPKSRRECRVPLNVPAVPEPGRSAGDFTEDCGAGGDVTWIAVVSMNRTSVDASIVSAPTLEAVGARRPPAPVAAVVGRGGRFDAAFRCVLATERPAATTSSVLVACCRQAAASAAAATGRSWRAATAAASVGREGRAAAAGDEAAVVATVGLSVPAMSAAAEIPVGTCGVSSAGVVGAAAPPLRPPPLQRCGGMVIVCRCARAAAEVLTAPTGAAKQTERLQRALQQEESPSWRRNSWPRARGASQDRAGAGARRQGRPAHRAAPPARSCLVNSNGATWRAGQTGKVARPPLLCRARRRARGPCQQAVFQSRRVRSARLVGPSSAAARRAMPTPPHFIHEPPPGTLQYRHQQLQADHRLWGRRWLFNNLGVGRARDPSQPLTVDEMGIPCPPDVSPL